MIEMSLTKVKKKRFLGWIFFLSTSFNKLTAFDGQHDVAFVVEVQCVAPFLALKELVSDLLHFNGTVLVFVEMNFIFIDLVL